MPMASEAALDLRLFSYQTDQHRDQECLTRRLNVV